MLDKFIADFMKKVDELQAEKERKLKEVELSLQAQREIEGRLRAEIAETNKQRKACEDAYNTRTGEILKLRDELKNELSERNTLLEAIRKDKEETKNAKDNARYFSDTKREELEKQARITRELEDKSVKTDKLNYELSEKLKVYDGKLRDLIAQESACNSKSDKMTRLEMILNDRESELNNRAAELRRLERLINGRQSQ